MLNFNAEADQVPADAIIDALVKETPVDALGDEEKRLMDSAVKR
jgi:hypothetical protein